MITPGVLPDLPSPAAARAPVLAGQDRAMMAQQDVSSDLESLWEDTYAAAAALRQSVLLGTV